jgi:protein TonB
VLDEAAVAAVKEWRFRPAQRAGRPVTATVEIPISFRLDDELSF